MSETAAVNTGPFELDLATTSLPIGAK